MVPNILPNIMLLKEREIRKGKRQKEREERLEEVRLMKLHLKTVSSERMVA